MAYIDQLLNSYTYRSIFVTVLSETGLTKDLLGKVFKNWYLNSLRFSVFDMWALRLVFSKLCSDLPNTTWFNKNRKIDRKKNWDRTNTSHGELFNIINCFNRNSVFKVLAWAIEMRGYINNFNHCNHLAFNHGSLSIYVDINYFSNPSG